MLVYKEVLLRKQMVLGVQACLRGTNLATFEQSLIKISINFTLQYGVFTLQYGVPLIDIRRIGCDSHRLFSSDHQNALRAAGGHAECGGIVYSLDYKARIHQPSTHFHRRVGTFTMGLQR